MDRKTIVKAVLVCILALVVGFAVMVYSLSPELIDFRTSIWGTIISRVILVGIILFVTLSKNIIGMPLIGKITVWAYGVLDLTTLIFDFGKIELFFFFLYAVVNVLVAIYIYWREEQAYRSICLFGIWSYIISIGHVLRCELINGEFPLTFLIPSIITAVIALIVCLIYAIKRFRIDRNKDMIALPILGLMLGFILVYLTMESMNVYLDTSEPTGEKYVIIDKDIHSIGRGGTTYEFVVENDGASFDIGVSQSVYYDYNVSDEITLSIYKGAFGEPYYIFDKNTN